MDEEGHKAGPGPQKVLDWEKVHRRQEAFRLAVERDFSPAGEERRRILRQRARDLAREPARADEGARIIEVVEFVLAYEQYAIESSFVREILPLRKFTPLPCTPSFVLGIMNVRGQIISIVDLKRFFELPEKGLADLNKVILLQSKDMEFGVLADSIIGATTLDENKLQPSLPTLNGIREQYLKGITAERTVVLDTEVILSDPKLIVYEEVGAR